MGGSHEIHVDGGAGAKVGRAGDGGAGPQPTKARLAELKKLLGDASPPVAEFAAALERKQVAQGP